MSSPGGHANEGRATPVAETDLTAALGRVFGFREFRPNQLEIVQAVLAGRDVFAVMPTGGGKSLCYQLPAYLMAGTCVVISPLISLMKDQVDAARSTGLAAEFINSSLDARTRGLVFGRLADGELDLLYVAPERFAMEAFLATLKSSRIAFFAVDEAHCISEWGHDFRPDYLTLSRIVAEFPRVPVAAFTATATQRVQQDIIARLGLRQPLSVRASFNRPNLFYQVTPKQDAERQVLEFVRARPTESGIVYRTTRSSVEETAEFLNANGVRARPYHAGLEDGARTAHQEQFNRDEVNVIVATIAFGMGIDKSNVRFVVHADMPKNIEGYYQETGRSGRDGEPAHCLLLFSYGDLSKLRYFVDKMEDERERSVASGKLNEMVNYAASNACRRRQLLGYFGERYEPDDCGGCDVCAGEVERVEATREAQIVMSAIARTEGRFGAVHVVDIVTGAETQRIRDLGHDRIKTYGVGKDRPKPFWRRIINDLLAQGCLALSDGQFPVPQLTDRGREVLFGRRSFHVLKQREAGGAKRARKRSAGGAAIEFDAELFEKLRGVRSRLARRDNVPPFVVFSDRTLHEMAAWMPATRQELAGLTGVGQQKLHGYGQAFLEAIGAFLRANPEKARPRPDRPPAGRAPGAAGADEPIRPVLNRTTEQTWQLLRQGLDIAQIARRRGLAGGTVAAHVEQLILAGRAVELDRLVPGPLRAELEEALRKSGPVGLRRAVEQTGADYDTARLVRAAMQAGGQL